MNKLFKEGDYVLLSDCKAFDEKYGLEEGAAIWAVARKMQDGEPNKDYMRVYQGCDIVGILTSDTGVWFIDQNFTTKLSVEDVLYRSQDGLTINELSKIAGAFDDGKEYKCVVGTNYIFNERAIYKANGEGIKDEYSFSTDGHTAKFKPITTKPNPKPWVPSVGEEVMTSNGRAKVEVVLDDEVCVSDAKGLDIENIACIKPIDKERESTIKKAVYLAETLDDSYTSRDFAIALYDAGMLKINHP